MAPCHNNYLICKYRPDNPAKPPHLIPINIECRRRAADGIRTRDLVLTKDALYQLSHSSLCLAVSTQPFKAGEGNRTLVFSLEGCGSTIELHPHKPKSLSRESTNDLCLQQQTSLNNQPQPLITASKQNTTPRSHNPGISVTLARKSQMPQMGGAGFEPAKAMPTDLQSAPFNHSGNLPRIKHPLSTSARFGWRSPANSKIRQQPIRHTAITRPRSWQPKTS